MNLIAVAKQALEALVWVDNSPRNFDRVRPAIASLTAAIAEMEKADADATRRLANSLRNRDKHNTFPKDSK